MGVVLCSRGEYYTHIIGKTSCQRDVAEQPRVILDLCSGLGGASEAFLSASIWRVIRIENNPALSDVPHTHTLDVLEWTDWIETFPAPEIIWASPPCRDFSRGFSAPAPTAEREGRVHVPDMSILKACMGIIDYFKPKWYIIENVQGAVDDFRPLLGEPVQKIGPFVLWGRFARIPMDYSFIHSKFTGDTWSTDPLRANRRALVPLEVSRALLDVAQEQMTLEDF